MDLGIGRGDSARRVLGKPPTTMATLEEAIVVIRDLVEGRTVELRGHRRSSFDWTGRWKLPVWIAGYGPMALAMTGRIADGVDAPARRPGPHPLVRRPGPRRPRWRPARPGRLGPGQAAAPAHVGDLEPCRDRTRWFPALVSQPRRRPRQQVPARGRCPRRSPATSATGPATTTTTTPRSARPTPAFVGDEVDRPVLRASARSTTTSRKLHELAAAGVDQFNLYLMNGDEEAILEIYGREIVPALRDVPAAAS